MSPETARMALEALNMLLSTANHGASVEHDARQAIAAIEAELAQAVDEIGVRGLLAAKLSCWHRLTEIESAELVALYTSRIAQPVEPVAWLTGDEIVSFGRMKYGFIDRRDRAIPDSWQPLYTSPPIPAGWQPIETAPKDGTAVLVYPPLWNERTCSIARFDDDKYSKKPRPFWARDDDLGRVSYSRANPPTNWMPLPAAPKA